MGKRTEIEELAERFDAVEDRSEHLRRLLSFVGAIVRDELADHQAGDVVRARRLELVDHDGTVTGVLDGDTIRGRFDNELGNDLGRRHLIVEGVVENMIERAASASSLLTRGPLRDRS